MAVKHVFADGTEFDEPENFGGFRIRLSKDTEWIHEILLGTRKTKRDGDGMEGRPRTLTASGK